MLTDEDIKKLIDVFATKEDIRDLKENVVGLRESVQALTISVDKLVKAVENLGQEYAAVVAKIDRHEKWIQQIAEKAGVRLEY
ncbi:hypothetical protein KKB68_01420 [Patescibacteria group bacterium]|nr:hypothetical protein [Patescibacteria group bacterium]